MFEDMCAPLLSITLKILSFRECMTPIPIEVNKKKISLFKCPIAHQRNEMINLEFKRFKRHNEN